MNIGINRIADAGVIEKERLTLSVVREDDIGYYLVCATSKLPDGKVSSSLRAPYWLPDKKVRAGDLVVVYSKQGTRSEKQNEDGSTSYFFYRGRSKPVWADVSDAAVLFRAGEWNVKGKNE